MKAKIEIDLKEAFVGCSSDGEEYHADFGDVIKTTVVDYVIRTRAPSINKIIEDELQKAFGNLMSNKVEEKIKEMFSNFMGSPIKIADGYSTKDYDSLTDYVEEKFSALYKAELGGAACSKDKLTSTISNSIRKIIQNDLLVATREAEKKGRVIANEALKTDNTLVALKSILKTQNS